MKSFLKASKAVLIIALAQFSLTSCAILAGVEKTDKVSISSDPIGASIFVDGVAKGVTPATLVLEAKNTKVVLVKEGFGSKEITLEAWATNKTAACATDAIFSIAPWALYSVQYSGRCNEFKQKDIHVVIPRAVQAGNASSVNSLGRNPQEMINYYYGR